LFGKKVRLPYPVITIEYYVHQKPTFTENGIEYQAICPKRFALASERKVGEKYVIDLCVVNYISTFSKWLPQPLGFVLDWEEKETFSKVNRVFNHVEIHFRSLVRTTNFLGLINPILHISFYLRRIISSRYHIYPV